MGPKLATSPVLTAEQEAMIVAFRRHTLLPLDDCLYTLQPTIPALTRSSLHRCLQRHGISRLPDPNGVQTAKKRFKACPIGFVCIAEGCRLMRLQRFTFYDAPEVPADEAAVVARVTAACGEFEAYGYRRVGAELRHQGVAVNGKKQRRLMREHDLQP